MFGPSLALAEFAGQTQLLLKPLHWIAVQLRGDLTGFESAER
jgi:hypothetical protein